VNADQLSACVSPSVALALRVANEVLVQASSGDTSRDSELLVVIHITRDSARRGIIPTVHVSPLAVVASAGMPASVAVAVAHQRRPGPFGAKSSAWVAQRQEMSALCPPDCTEVITTAPLACDEEASSSACAPLLEGLVNNLFIVATHSVDDAQTRVVVQTASVEEGALPGIIRIAVLAACHDFGYTVIEAAPVAPPDGKGHVRWTEAFLCNAVRLLQPIRLIRWLPPCARPELHFQEAPGPVTRAIQAHVMQALASEDQLSPPF